MEDLNLGNEKDNDEVFFCDACDDFPFFDCTETLSESIEFADDVPAFSSVTALYSETYPGNMSSANLRRRRRPSAADSGDSNHDKSSFTSGNGYVHSDVEKHGFLPGINGVKEELQHVSQDYTSPEESKFSLGLKSKNSEIGMPDESCVITPKNGQVVDDPVDYYDVKSSSISDSNFKQNDDGVEDKVGLEEKPIVSSATHDIIKDVIEVDSRPEDIPAVFDVNFRGNSDYVEDNARIAGNHDENTSFLLMLATFMIRAISFKLHIMVYAFMWPFWLMYSSYRIVTDPFHAVRRCRQFFIHRVMGLWGYARCLLSDSLCEFLEEHKSFLKLGLKLGWGLLWSAYVCVVLVCLLVAAFVVGGILMKVLVDEPIRIRDKLNFDYTEFSPVAYVPVAPGAKCGFGFIGRPLDANLGGGVDCLPPKHKLQVTVSLTLPESDYNKNLGIFQVRVDFLGADGELVSSSRRPCMLRFNSEPIRLFLTFFKMAPLLTGYSTESQDVSIKLRSVAPRGDKPITCLRVMIEERAQLKPGGAGIPQIYSASVSLESVQPFLKRIVWFWRRTLFVWISMIIFMVELLLVLTCCTSTILPKVKLGFVNSAANATR